METTEELYHEDLIMHFLRMNRGLIVAYWASCEKVAVITTGHEMVPVSKAVRKRERVRLGKTLATLIQQGKVIRYPHPKNNLKRGVRINEAYADFRSIHHERQSAA